MTYNGFEIDMLDVGDADCVLVTRWRDGWPWRVLIDGGNKTDAATVRAFLQRRGINRIHHVVCSHPHDDHAGGLVDVVADRSIRFDCGWMHMPWLHMDEKAVKKALGLSNGLQEAIRFEKSLETATSLYDVFVTRGILVFEPFAGEEIAFLQVCGPTEAYYEELLGAFADVDRIRSRQESHSRALSMEAIGEMILQKAATATKTHSLLDDPRTSPENNSSTVLEAIVNGGKYLLTADAGAQALALAADLYDLETCHCMHIPHHGSRRNITMALIEHFRPSVAFISASGSKKHPRRAVVNAFKKAGARVYSTHYPTPGHIWHHRGTVPPRSDYAPFPGL